jgi:hypothetical protein
MKHAEEHGILVRIGGFRVIMPCGSVRGGLVSGTIGHPIHKGVWRENIVAVLDILVQL